MDAHDDAQRATLLVPDTSFKLSTVQRARVRPGFDIDALERLLSHFKPAFRNDILESFTFGQPGEVSLMTSISDPQLQAILEDVYAPRWKRMTDEELARPEAVDLPGRERERLRRLSVTRDVTREHN